MPENLRLFDAYLMADWSANSTPKVGPDSIWLAWGAWTNERLEWAEPVNPATRAAAKAVIAALLAQWLSEKRRVLLSFDFAYGYPHGFAKALALDGPLPAWRKTWDALAGWVEDAPDNRNNRFSVASDLNARLGGPGPFWMCPAATPTLLPTRKPFPHLTPSSIALDEYRHADSWLRSRGAYLQSAWKLFGPGSVGSQVVMGLPVLAALRDDPRFASHSAVWPFETGLTPRPVPADGPFILHAEIWPGATPVDLSRHPIKDAAQMLSLVSHFSGLDAQGKLGDYFLGPTQLSHEARAVCVEEEGWILGA